MAHTTVTTSPGGASTAPPGGGAHDKVHARPRPWRWVSGLLVAVAVAMFLHMLVSSPNLQWDVVADYMFDNEILHGLWVTVELTFIAIILGIVIGTIVAIMRRSGNPLVRYVAWTHIWFFRGVPPLVQLVFWYNFASLVPEISIGIPFGPSWLPTDVNTIMTPMAAAILGLSLTESAYAAEVIRSGIDAVGKGQLEAAETLGMTRAQAMRRIILPQALRIVIPPIGNDTIGMLKFTSLVSVLALGDLLYSAQVIYSRTYQTIPLLIVATLWYMVLTTILTVLENRLEHRLSNSRGAKLDLGKRWRLFPASMTNRQVNS